MVKKVVQDINIKKPKLLRFEESRVLDESSTLDPQDKFAKITQMQKNRRYIPRTPQLKKKKLLSRAILILLILAIAVSLVYISYSFFQKATISVNTKKQDFSFKEELFTSYKQDEKKPHFEIMILNDVYSRKMSFSDPKDVSIKAKGIVFIKNEYSVKPQKVPVNTKIIDDYGKVYTTDSTITVPGFTKSKDKITPGSIAVKVTAISPGEEYNTSSKNFLLPSLEKTDKYTKIYGVSSNPISGGALGKLYSLGPVELGTLNAEANTIFKEQIMRKLAAQIPPGYVYYPGGTNFSYSLDEDSRSKESIGDVEILGTVNAVIFKKDDLEDVFIRKAGPTIPLVEYDEIHVADMSKFTLKLADKNKLISKDLNELTFVITGSSTLQWSPDLEDLKRSVLGIAKSDLNNTTRIDPGILNATVDFLLPFQNKIPNKPNMVDIKTY
ncbi:MAG: hypothetical protein WC089_00825 [Candidatus Paceibacterota bacterium]